MNLTAEIYSLGLCECNGHTLKVGQLEGTFPFMSGHTSNVGYASKMKCSRGRGEAKVVKDNKGVAFYSATIKMSPGLNDFTHVIGLLILVLILLFLITHETIISEYISAVHKQDKLSQNLIQ